jgi:hypothetical protein
MNQLTPRGDNSPGLPLGVTWWDRRQAAALQAQTSLAQLASHGEAARVDTRRADARHLADRIVDDMSGLHRHIAYEAADDPALAMSLAEVERTFASGSTAMLRSYLSGRW